MGINMSIRIGILGYGNLASGERVLSVRMMTWS